MSEGFTHQDHTSVLFEVMRWPETFECDMGAFRDVLEARLPQLATYVANHSPFPGVRIGPPHILEQWSDLEVPVRMPYGAHIPLLLPDVVHAFRSVGKLEAANWYEVHFTHSSTDYLDNSLMMHNMNTQVLLVPWQGGKIR